MKPGQSYYSICRMTRLRSAAILTVLVFFGKGCMVIPAGERRIPRRIDGHPFGQVQYEMINWRLDSPGREYLVAMIEGSFANLSPAKKGHLSDWRLEIVLEPDLHRGELATNFVEHPGRAALYVVDDVLFGQTVFIFPWIRRIDRRVSFVVWNGDRTVRTYSYDSDYYLVGGFSSFLALPFSLRNYVKHDMARVARLFIEDATRDGLMGAGGNGAEASREFNR